MTFKYPKIKILYEFLDQLTSSLVFILILYVFNYNTDSTFLIGMKYIYGGILIIAMNGRLVETIFTKVEFAVDGVHVYTGVFSKSERFIPREKFENVQTSASVLQRIFRAQKVVMETGDATGDVTLNFVKAAQVEQMQAYVLSNNEDKMIAIQAEEDKDILFTPTIGDILKAAIMSFSFFALIPIALNIWDDLKIGKVVDPSEVVLPTWLTVLLVILAILAALIIGVVKTFNSYYRYKISMDEERIYVKKGWLSQQSFALRKEKVQAVVYKQSLYQKLLRVTTIKLISTGEVNEVDDAQINELFPYLPTAKADELVAQLLPQFTRKPMPHKASLKAKKLIWLRPPLFIIIIALAGLWQPIFYAIAVAVLVLTYVSRVLAYKNLGFDFDGAHLQARTGGIVVETIVTKRPKLIQMEYESTILQRKAGVMSVKFVNRSQPVHYTKLQDIDLAMQEGLKQWFNERVHEVNIDSRTVDGSLKKEAIQRLVQALKR